MWLILVFLAVFYISIDRIYGEGITQILPSSSAMIGPLPKISIDGLYSSRFITYTPPFTLSGRLSREQTPISLGSFWQYFFLFQN